MSENRARVVVSGSSWMGGGFGSIESAIHDLFAQATDEVIMTAFAVSGAARGFFREFETLLERGIKIRMLINRYDNQPDNVRGRLEGLRKKYPAQLQLLSFVSKNEEADLHAKIIIVDRQYALIGSANLSQRGLLDNHELAMVLEGPAVADIVKAVDLLLNSSQVVSVTTVTGC